MPRDTLDEITRRYSAAVYYELAIPRWQWWRKWRARREWGTWLRALRYYIENDQ